jgi:hypothetical protein
MLKNDIIIKNYIDYNKVFKTDVKNIKLYKDVSVRYNGEEISLAELKHKITTEETPQNINFSLVDAMIANTLDNIKYTSLVYGTCNYAFYKNSRSKILHKFSDVTIMFSKIHNYLIMISSPDMKGFDIIDSVTGKDITGEQLRNKVNISNMINGLSERNEDPVVLCKTDRYLIYSEPYVGLIHILFLQRFTD